MRWSEEAEKAAKAIVRSHSDDLYEEAERVTVRAQANTVAPAYVTQAATTVAMRKRSSAVADVFLAIGPALAGIAGGVGVIELTATQPLYLHAWITGTAIGVGALGMLLSGAGGALKLRR